MERIWSHGKLYSALAGMILVGTIDSVLYIRLTHKMEHYEWFLSQVAMTLGFLIVIVPIVLYRMFVTRCITKEMRKCPFRIFFFIAGLDALANLIGTIPSPYLPGPFIGIFGRAHIIFIFIGSMIYLRVRYTILHWMAAIIIMSAVLINAIPFFQEHDVGTHHLFWGGLVMVSMIPMVCSSLYKEKNLKQRDMDVWYFNAWVAFFQLFIGLTTIWSELIPFPSPATHIKITDMGTYMTNAFECFISGNDNDVCGHTFVIFIIFIVFNVLSNVLVLYVYKKGSATMAIVGGTSILALSNLGFHLPILAGEAVETSFSGFNLIALWIMLCGIVIYNVNDEIRHDYNNSDGGGGGDKSVTVLDAEIPSPYRLNDMEEEEECEEGGCGEDPHTDDELLPDGSTSVTIEHIGRMMPLDSSDDEEFGNPFVQEYPENNKKKKRDKGKEKMSDDSMSGIELKDMREIYQSHHHVKDKGE